VREYLSFKVFIPVRVLTVAQELKIKDKIVSEQMRLFLISDFRPWGASVAFTFSLFEDTRFFLLEALVYAIFSISQFFKKY
jgi:hypothetical protein